MEIEFTPTDADLQEIKAILNQTNSTTHDEYILTMLPLLLEDAMVQTNNNFGGIKEDGSLRIPGGVKIYLAKAIEYNLQKSGIKSRSMGSVSYSYETELPAGVKKYLRPYKKVTFNG